MKYYIFMALDKAPRLVFILIFVKFNQTANTGTAMLSTWLASLFYILRGHLGNINKENLVWVFIHLPPNLNFTARSLNLYLHI